MSASDTICALGSAAGGGIGIVRVSGPGARAVLSRLVRPWPAAPESHRLYFARAIDPASGEALDEVLACLMAAPRSYTGEDVAELHGHGGARNLARLLEAACVAGARLAEPGEFTRRAFLAGRLDLTQAEAVAEVIAARSDEALRVAQAQLGGALRLRIEALHERLVALLAELEGRIDFPEEITDSMNFGPLAAGGAQLGREIEGLAGTYGRGRRLSAGIEVALCGRTNAGKSSLLNALAGAERALVDEAPGTTRDVVEVEVDFGGVRARLVDSAGERGEELGSGVEARGIELGRQRRAGADVRVLVVDGSLGFGVIERGLAEPVAGLVVAWNKADLAPRPVGVPAGLPVVVVAAARGEGLEALRQAILTVAGVAGAGPGLTGLAAAPLGAPEGVVVTTARQRSGLDTAVGALDAGVALLLGGAAPELAAVELRAALGAIERVSGLRADGAVLDAVFARFCIGK